MNHNQINSLIANHHDRLMNLCKKCSMYKSYMTNENQNSILIDVDES